MIGIVVLITAHLFVDLKILHPFFMIVFLVLTCVSFSLFGFIIGVWAKNFDQVQMIPLLVLTPLVFLGGSFYSISMLPPIWQSISMFNPIFYLISGFRWSFFGTADVGIGLSLMAIATFTCCCIGVITWIFKTGYRIKS
jgi:ABC-2 type transport system permease protein